MYILVLVPFHMLSLTRRTLDKERVANIHHLAAKLGYALHFAYRRFYFGLLSRTPSLSVADCIPKNWVFLPLGLPGIWLCLQGSTPSSLRVPGFELALIKHGWFGNPRAKWASK